MNVVEPAVGMGRRVAVAKLLAKFHPEAPRHVLAFVAVGDGPRTPPGVAGRDLNDGLVAGRGQHRVDFGHVASRRTRTSAILGGAGRIGHDRGGFRGHAG